MVFKMIFAIVCIICAGFRFVEALEYGGHNWLVFAVYAASAVIWFSSAYSDTKE